MSDAAAIRLWESVKNRLPAGAQVMVIEDGATLYVVSGADTPAVVPAEG